MSKLPKAPPQSGDSVYDMLAAKRRCDGVIFRLQHISFRIHKEFTGYSSHRTAERDRQNQQ